MHQKLHWLADGYKGRIRYFEGVVQLLMTGIKPKTHTWGAVPAISTASFRYSINQGLQPLVSTSVSSLIPGPIALPSPTGDSSSDLPHSLARQGFS
ncbi:hypothetical protein VP01_258g5 [Puccinia sorghi]|uniref:Uncharacterized protein n=1 Tax=Puccinia sorghi TaxID=27349 RepID=A0A0L6V4S6_9BASI|nr:hypothetical protein VP01_258g5 [Puccinia sorghi]